MKAEKRGERKVQAKSATTSSRKPKDRKQNTDAPASLLTGDLSYHNVLFAFPWIENSVLGKIPRDLHALLYSYCNRAYTFKPKYELKTVLGNQHQYNNPHGLAVDREGHVYLADTNGNQIVVYKPDGSRRTICNSEVNTPIALAFTPEEDLLVLEFQTSQVQVFTKDGRALRKFGHQGSGAGELSTPLGIACGHDGTIIVADSGIFFSLDFFGLTRLIGNRRIQRFKENGDYIDQIGQRGSAGQFDHPLGVGVDRFGNITSTDDATCEVHMFDVTGRFIRAFGGRGSNPGQFQTPGGLCVDGHGQLGIIDQGNKRVQFFGPQGNFLYELGSTQTWPARALQGPWTITIGPEGNLYALDQNLHRVEIFG